ncbi:unnamed protein product [Dovyalis caffra]|uniref:Uncharacterized protein n=1 Tax=Dovyalis caffra TaxID=77055 RepID=A0AAV1S5Y1_9ROSI|nr:unnamed protein product [Dovyalis caffra]
MDNIYLPRYVSKEFVYTGNCTKCINVTIRSLDVPEKKQIEKNTGRRDLEVKAGKKQRTLKKDLETYRDKEKERNGVRRQGVERQRMYTGVTLGPSIGILGSVKDPFNKRGLKPHDLGR